MLDAGMVCSTVADETNLPQWKLIDSANPMAGVQGTWQGTQCPDGGSYSTTIKFTCDKSKNDGTATNAVSGQGSCNFVLTVPSVHGCPVGGGLSGGSIFLIIFFSLGFFYFVGGIVYNKKV